MNKKEFTNPIIEIVSLCQDDLISTSGNGTLGEDANCGLINDLFNR